MKLKLRESEDSNFKSLSDLYHLKNSQNEFSVKQYLDGRIDKDELTHSLILGGESQETIDNILSKSIKESEEPYEEIATKQVLDSDGFFTDYTLYFFDNKYVCIFGDKDLYNPSNADIDFETEYKEEAIEWFNFYNGFGDMQDSEGTQVTDIEKKVDYPTFKVGKKITNLVEGSINDIDLPYEVSFIIPSKNNKLTSYKFKTEKEMLDYLDSIAEFIGNGQITNLKYTGKSVKESYNYFGTDVNEEPRDSKYHKEHVWHVRDAIGDLEIDFKSQKAAQKWIDDHKDDDIYKDKDIYPDGPQFEIDDYTMDVSNKKIVLPDDLA